MLLSTKIEYAIRGLTELANSNDGKPLTIKQICTEQNLPVKYMEQLFSKLKHNNIIKSIKGAKGGYLMNCADADLSVKDVMTALDDRPIKLDCCSDQKQRNYCVGHPCPFYSAWLQIQDDIDNYFDNIKLTRFIDPDRQIYDLSNGGNNGKQTIL